MIMLTNLSKCPERLVPDPGQVAAEREGRGEARQQQAEAQQDQHLKYKYYGGLCDFSYC